MLEGFLFSGVTNFRVEQVIAPKRLMSGLCLAVSFVCFFGLLCENKICFNNVLCIWCLLFGD